MDELPTTLKTLSVDQNKVKDTVVGQFWRKSEQSEPGTLWTLFLPPTHITQNIKPHTEYQVVDSILDLSDDGKFYLSECGDVVGYLELLTNDESAIDTITWCGQTLSPIMLGVLYQVEHGTDSPRKLIFPNYYDTHPLIPLNSQLSTSVDLKLNYKTDVKLYVRGYKLTHSERLSMMRTYQEIPCYSYQGPFELPLCQNSSNVFSIKLKNVGLLRELYCWIKKTDGKFVNIKTFKIFQGKDEPIAHFNGWVMRERSYQVTYRRKPNDPIHNQSFYIKRDAFESGYLNLGQEECTIVLTSEQDCEADVQATLYMVTYNMYCIEGKENDGMVDKITSS